jgi:recombination protein RecA
MVKQKKETKTDGRAKGVELAVKEIQQKYGDGSIMKLGDAKKVDVDTISTGSISLDLALGVGGIPRGRIIEIYGPESSGKTTLALHVVAEVQKMGGIAAYVDAEHALDPEYGRKIGVNVADLLISQPDTGEQALEIVETLVRSGGVDLIVVDSVAALTPRAEIEGEMDQQHMGLQARLMSHALRKLTAIVAKSGTTIIFINQIRHKIGVMFGCLNYKSMINIKGRKNEWIGKVVNQKKKLEVMSYDWEKEQIIPKPITNWFNNGRTDKFLQIKTYKPLGNGKAQISCTPNHPILTPVGWRKAEDLKNNDLVMIGIPTRLNQLQMEIIRGSLMGDGALSFSASNRLGVRFRMGHGKNQKSYLRWKASFFSNVKQTISVNKKNAIFCDLTPLPELYPLRKSMYINDQKFLPPDFIAGLTPLSLAIWYMDDGHLDIRDEKRTKGRIAFCVEMMMAESRVSLKNYLENKYGILTRLGKQGHNNVLFFNQDNSDKFMQLIRRYIHPSMKYKLLPRHYYYFDIKPVLSEPIWKPLAVPIIDIHKKPVTRSMTRFDINVKGTHNFLADGIIVHNSPETTTGGLALKFYSSVRIEVRRAAQIQAGEKIVGNRVKAKVVKNKVAPPFRTAEFDILYNEGISKVADLINTGVTLGVVAKSGSWYNFGDQKLGQGIDGSRQFLKENPKIVKTISDAVKKAAIVTEG